MVLEESCKAVFLGQSVVIVLNAQKQIMPLWYEISEANVHIKASEIEIVEPVIVKQLLADIDQSVERAVNSRLIKRRRRRCDNKIALFAATGESDIRCPVKRRAGRDCERLILFYAFENLLLTKIGVTGRSRDITAFSTGRRYGGWKSRRSLFTR